jgi:hypothetical protein
MLHLDVLEVDHPQLVVRVRQRRWLGPFVQEGWIREALDGWQRGDDVRGRIRALEPQPCPNRDSARTHARRMEAAVEQIEEGDGGVGVVEGHERFYGLPAAANGQSFEVNSTGNDRVRALIVDTQNPGVRVDDVTKQSRSQEDVGDDQIREGQDGENAQSQRDEPSPASTLRQRPHVSSERLLAYDLCEGRLCHRCPRNPPIWGVSVLRRSDGP